MLINAHLCSSMPTNDHPYPPMLIHVHLCSSTPTYVHPCQPTIIHAHLCSSTQCPPMLIHKMPTYDHPHNAHLCAFTQCPPMLIYTMPTYTKHTMPTYAHPHNAHLCSSTQCPPMLIHAHLCSFKPTYVHPCPPTFIHARQWSSMSTYAHSCPPMLIDAHLCSSMPTYAYPCPPILIHAHLCSFMPTYAHPRPPMIGRHQHSLDKKYLCRVHVCLCLDALTCIHAHQCSGDISTVKIKRSLCTERICLLFMFGWTPAGGDATILYKESFTTANRLKHTQKVSRRMPPVLLSFPSIRVRRHEITHHLISSGFSQHNFAKFYCI